MFSSAAKERKQDQEAAAGCDPEADDEKGEKGSVKASKGGEEDNETFDDDDHGLQRAHQVRFISSPYRPENA